MKTKTNKLNITVGDVRKANGSFSTNKCAFAQAAKRKFPNADSVGFSFIFNLNKRLGEIDRPYTHDMFDKDTEIAANKELPSNKILHTFNLTIY